jgi:hypothetical protein
MFLRDKVWLWWSVPGPVRRRLTAVVLTLAAVFVVCEMFRLGVMQELIKYGFTLFRIGGAGP